jgi:hypothetical protein
MVKKKHGGRRRFLNHGEGQRIDIGWVSRDNKTDIPDSIDMKCQHETGAGGSDMWRGCVGQCGCCTEGFRPQSDLKQSDGPKHLSPS